MKLSWLTIILPCILLLSCSGKSDGPAPVANAPTATTAPVQATPLKDYTFDNAPTWADEFDGAKIDTAKWGYDLGGGGWGNHELQVYTSTRNSAVANGNLIITADRANLTGGNYGSSRLFSKGAGNFLYGRIEVKAKIPAGRGTWPAIWMLPTDNAYGGWPKSGEMDIMEHVGYDPNNIHITMHTQAYNHVINTQRGATTYLSTATTDYHIYRLDWTPDGITGFIDGDKQFYFRNEGTGSAAWPFDKRFHLMLNVAVGGDWGGAKGVDDSIFPVTMNVDYVRYYKINNL